MGENVQETTQVKGYQQYLENKENKADLIDRFTQYIQQDHVHSKLKGNVIFNSRDVSYRINSSELKILFNSNHEEADTEIVFCCSSFNKPCLLKTKDTDMLILIIYTVQFNNPSTICTCKQTKILLIALEKFMRNLAVPLACCCHTFMQPQFVIQLITSLMFQNE